MSSSEDSTTRVEAMLSCSLLDCSLLDCGSVSEAESELSRAGIRVGMWGYRVRGAMLAASVAYSTFSHCFVDVGRLAILLYDEGLHRLKDLPHGGRQ